MNKKKMFSKDEVDALLKEIARHIRDGAFNDLKSLHKVMFDGALEENEVAIVHEMAGSGLEWILQYLGDYLEDIESGRYLPKEEEAAA